MWDKAARKLFWRFQAAFALFVCLEYMEAALFGGSLVGLLNGVHVDAARCTAAHAGEGNAAQLIFARGEYRDCAQFALHGFGADTAALALNGVVAAINFYVGGGAGCGFQAA